MGAVDEKFWTALGGKGPITPAEGRDFTPGLGKDILYEIQIPDKGRSRKLNIKQVTHGDHGLFRHEDLAIDGIMMFDTRNEIMLWIGENASGLEKNQAEDIAQHYLKTNSRIGEKISIMKQGEESDAWRQI